MAINPENEDALKAVEQILLNAQAEKRCFGVKLPIDTAVRIAVSVHLKIPLNRIFAHEEEYGEESQRIVSGLKEKFRPVAYESIEGLKDVSIHMSAEEVDLLNRISLDYIGLYRQAGREKWFPEDSEAKIMSESRMQKWMADFIILNRAFIQAGGQARPEFTRII